LKGQSFRARRSGGAQLQGAWLYKAQLQGASLDYARLQGASLGGAQIQGASLDFAELQGASLDFAELQGASLYGAKVNATDFSNAFLWRTKWREIDQAELGSFRLDTVLEQWKPVWYDSGPVPWTVKAYAELRVSMNSIPEGTTRDTALKRIERLDCGNPDKTLASCDPNAAPPPEVFNWQKALLKANANNAAFQKALAKELGDLVCANDAEAIHILHGTSKRLAATGREAPALVDFIMTKDCPVAASLTDDDKAKLLQIKRDAEKKFAPPPTAKKDK
jgi:uncharacterized protein YjbI with pentapeptide repeats